MLDYGNILQDTHIRVKKCHCWLVSLLLWTRLTTLTWIFETSAYENVLINTYNVMTLTG